MKADDPQPLAMGTYRTCLLIVASIVATILVAIHAPGQMSVDSVTALYESQVGRAVGWGPPFFAAVLAWLGGGSMGAAIFVALNTLATYGVFVALLLAGVEPGRFMRWRVLVALVLAVNPLFMFYVGILWKDVLLATCAASAIVLLLLQPRWRGVPFLLSMLCATICIAALPLIRQQGVLLSVPLALASAWSVASRAALTRPFRLATAAGVLVLTGMIGGLLAKAAASRVAPLPASPVSVGIATIQVYDIIGMVAYARPDDAAAWTEAGKEAIRRMQVGYSPERIDTLWRDEAVRGYSDNLASGRLQAIWWSGIKHDPVAYLTHRVQAFATLMGVGDVIGCVPAYWGVAGDSRQLAAVGLTEEMDPRDRMLGRLAGWLAPSPVFRHWWYAGLLLVAGVFLLRKHEEGGAFAARAAAVGAGAYLLSFLPTTIACDVRYLYPVAMVATLLCIHLLLRPRGLAGAVSSARTYKRGGNG